MSSIGMKLKACIDAVLDLLYPPDLYCVCCGKIIDDSRIYRLCNDCMDGIKWISIRTCGRCGKQLGDNNPSDICFSCREHKHDFDRGYTCAEYGAHERAIVFALKYDGRTDIAATAGEIMHDRMNAEFGDEKLRMTYDMVVPVPIHRRKQAIRGFNQASLIAKEFAARAGLICDDDLLVRMKDTRMMRSLEPEKRRENIRGAFGIKEGRHADVIGRSILVVDDIYTTGSTIDEIAAVLREAEASRVDFITFASGADMVKAD